MSCLSVTLCALSVFAMGTPPLIKAKFPITTDISRFIDVVDKVCITTLCNPQEDTTTCPTWSQNLRQKMVRTIYVLLTM
jgi:hypothetical protein